MNPNEGALVAFGVPRMREYRKEFATLSLF
jgi:hypothetical protein